MFGNSMSQVENYRLFVVYHLQNLKSLDGNIIEIDEESAAKESLGGRLDTITIETSNFEYSFSRASCCILLNLCNNVLSLLTFVFIQTF